MNSQLGIGIYVHSYEYQHENNFTWSSFKILNLFQLFEKFNDFCDIMNDFITWHHLGLAAMVVYGC